MSEAVETTETAAKRGRKPSPVTAANAWYAKASAKAEKARAAYEKVQEKATAKEQAEAEEQEAYQAVLDALAEVAPPTLG